MGKVYSIGSVLGVLLFSYCLDRIWEALRLQNARTFAATPSLWFAGLIDLAFAGAVLALGWFVLAKSEKSYVLSSIYAFVGMLLLLSYPLRALAMNTSFRFLVSPTVQSLAVAPSSYVYHAAAFVGVIGVIGVARNMRVMISAAQAEA